MSAVQYHYYLFYHLYKYGIIFSQKKNEVETLGIRCLKKVYAHNSYFNCLLSTTKKTIFK